MDLTAFLEINVMAFILAFVRVGAIVTIMPGIGDSFVPQRIRLLIALALAVVLFPVVSTRLPEGLEPGTGLLTLIAIEFIIGLLIGTVARILMTALDTAGMVVSLQSGLGSAQMFNPAMATQGSLFGAFLSITGVVILFSSGMYYVLLGAVVESYNFFPMGTLPATADMAQTITKTVSASFALGIQIALPFFAIAMILYIGMGILSRLMPQIQVFLLALPAQILLALLTLMLVISGMLLFWLDAFGDGLDLLF